MEYHPTWLMIGFLIGLMGGLLGIGGGVFVEGGKSVQGL